MSLVPLFWLAWLHWRKREPGLAWWWLAGAFAVSWLADTGALWLSPWLVGAVYPVSQAAIIGAVLLSRSEAIELTIALVLIGILDVYANGITGPDILLRVTAWGAVTGILVPLRQLGRLRAALLVYFGVGLLAWMYYVIEPAWLSWSLYQIVRAIGIAMFCWAAMRPQPRLRVS